MSGLKFDASVNLGHLLTIGAMIVGGAAAYTSIKVELAQLHVEVKGFQEDLDKLERRFERLEQR